MGTLRGVLPLRDGPFQRVGHARGSPRIRGPEDRGLFFEHIYLESDVDGYDGISERWSQPVMLLSEVAGGRLERSLRYRELTGPLGLGFEVRGACMAGRERWGGIELTRERGDPDFDAREVVLLRRPVPGRRPEGVRAPFAGRSHPTRRRCRPQRACTRSSGASTRAHSGCQKLAGGAWGYGPRVARGRKTARSRVDGGRRAA